METIILASESPSVTERMARLVPPDLTTRATVRQKAPDDSLLEFLRYEIPELLVLHLGEGCAPQTGLLEGLEQDPWLDSVGIILVVPDVDEVIEVYRGFNVAYFLNEHELERNLGRVIRLLSEKREFLNYDGVIKKITALSGELILETDLLLVQYYSSLFSNYLYKEGFVDRSKKFSAKLTLEELLTNAMEHGNAGITYEEKTDLQAQGRTIQDAMEERMGRAPWRGRTVTLEYSISPPASRFTITDQGAGFDTARLPSAQDMASLDLSHGRGIFLSMNSADQLNYNRKGNSVTVQFQHNGVAGRSVPPGFIQAEPRHLAPGDVVFRENALGDHLYYIVSGEYDVFVGKKVVARLNPSDVFMGEMSFLLGNRRTATVVAASPGKLVEISRQTFTDAVKRFPNYGIFLSKMLARRLRDNNRRFAG